MTFEKIQQNAITEWESLNDGEVPRIYICITSYSYSLGMSEVLNQIKTTLAQNNIRAQIIEVGCLIGGPFEPLIYLAKPRRPCVCYSHVTPKIASQIVIDYIVNDNIRPDIALCSLGDEETDGIPNISELPIFRQQLRIALRNCGFIDPGNINHYIAMNGYSGFVRALNMTHEEVLEEVSKAGLKGRGGAGFETGTKLRLCHDTISSKKYIICNAHDDGSGSFIGQTLFEGDPHSVLEGMLIGAYAIGASDGYIYIRSEHLLATTRLRNALKQIEACGLLGNNILGHNFSFHVEIKDAARDLVCGEETAMIRSLEGKRATPYTRPPFPAISGFKSKPTLINNVETWANMSVIFQKGAEWYCSYGTDESKGTKIFALGGSIMRTGLIEVEMGLKLYQVVYDIGGGIPHGKDFKAIQIGGPLGGFLPADALNLGIDYKHLTDAETIMGSGNIIVADSDYCMVDLAKKSLSLVQHESCGKCVFCREGSVQLLEILTDITEGKGKPEDLDLLLELGEGMKLGALCNLGKSAPNPLLSTIKHFREEYIEHINHKRCPAKVCQKLIN